MKKTILTALALALSCTTMSAGSNQSPFAAKLSKELNDKPSKESKLLSADIWISAMLKVNSKFDLNSAKKLGVKFPTITNNILTARIPISKYTEFSQINGIDYLDVGGFATPQMDSAKSVVHIQKVIDGMELPQSYQGEGVVVGIIDAGFDYTHPAFYNSESNELIISRVWEQGKTGTAPQGFEYGRELSNPTEILAAEKDITDFSHGTHVAGIAAGQSVAGAEKFQGIASKSELVIVALKPPAQEQWKNTGASDIVDAVNYIFKYAESVGKPAVVNLSWGGQIGPHDGTSLFSQAIDGLVGKGKIFVCSAGNDGAVNLHANKTLSPTDSLFVTYSYNYYSPDATQNGIWYDVWGEQGKPFEFKFDVVDPITLESKYATDFLSTAKDTIFEYIYKADKDSCNIMVYVNTCAFNDKPHAFVNLEGNKAFWGKISAKAKEGTIHAWNWYLIDYYGIERQFWAKNDPLAVNGNKYITISDFASTKRAIAVGAMVSKRNYINIFNSEKSLNGTMYDLAPFSSHGPTVDNRVKPDIVAPGMGLVASVSSFDSGYINNGGSMTSVILNVEQNTKQFPYAILSGTSMSSPAASGAIALLLSANPKLTPEEVIDLLKTTSTQDDFTQTLPNELWGNGKMNLHKAMKKLLGIGAVDNSKQNDWQIFPNPFFNTIQFASEELVNSELMVYDVNGNCVLNHGFVSNYETVSGLSHLANGIYLISISKSGKVIYSTVVVKE